MARVFQLRRSKRGASLINKKLWFRRTYFLFCWTLIMIIGCLKKRRESIWKTGALKPFIGSFKSMYSLNCVQEMGSHFISHVNTGFLIWTHLMRDLFWKPLSSFISVMLLTGKETAKQTLPKPGCNRCSFLFKIEFLIRSL